MPRSSPSFSFSSSSFSSTSASSFSARRLKAPSTIRLKRWFSTHLQFPLSRHNVATDPLYDGLSQYTSQNTVAKTSNTSTETNTDRSGTHPSSTDKTLHDPSASQHRFTGFEYDYEYPNGEVRYGHGLGNDSDRLHRHHRHYYNRYSDELGYIKGGGRHDDADEEEEDVVLADSYAAFCRAFTSSPIHSYNMPAQPLPRLPTSETWEEYQGSLVDADAASTERVAQISFLPVGAHGYHPASWVLPRPPSPPSGILTPARYEIQQKREMAELEKDRQKQRRRLFMWCLPIRIS
ncbi:hypothetical protein BDW72DRAFT_57995 [Aspergillus terricola var. indicus]